jgi:uncharacterized protein involved in exopolysaccharide biosynthesis
VQGVRVTPSQQSSIDRRDDLDLFALSQVLWRHRILIAGTTFVCALVAVILALLATPIFRAEAVVTDVREGGMGATSAIASQFGGLASLAGLNLGQTNDTEQSQAVLASRHLVEEFVKRNDLVPLLFKNSKQPPTLWLGVKRFKERVLTVNKDTRKGVTMVAIEWTDPATAARWANGFVALANELLRTRALDDSNRNIAYLNGQLGQTNVVELRKVIYDIIESETKTLMLASGRTQYAFQVVDPAVPPEERSSPRRTLIVMVGGALGLFIGVIIAFIRDMLARRERSASQNLQDSTARLTS